MTAEAVLLTVYAVVLLGVAQGLRRLGRRSTSPWASRTLVGHLRVTDEEPVSADDWPHNEVPRLYAGMALTAALAAMALAVAGLALHRESSAAVVLALVIGLAATSVVRITTSICRSAHTRL